MLIGDIHSWLGKASGGTGTVFRWVWASLIAVCLVGFVYLAKLALG
jgi:hypothetical protein